MGLFSISRIVLASGCSILVKTFLRLSEYANNITALEAGKANAQPGWTGKPHDDISEGKTNPDLVGKTTDEQIEYWNEKITLEQEDWNNQNNFIHFKQTELQEIEAKLAEWTIIKEKWDAENLN